MTNKEKMKAGLQQLESSFGKLSGGFVVLSASANADLIGGTEANNCHGSNCTTGCGTNLEAGCGANTNTVAGCGSKANTVSF